jgi:hypothetical protein
VFLPRLLASIPSMRREHVASACTAAVLSHHGGWLTEVWTSESQDSRLVGKIQSLERSVGLRTLLFLPTLRGDGTSEDPWNN